MLKNILFDRHGRIKSTLRISVTDKCNLRCKYCVVSSNIPFLEKESLMTFDEMKRILGIFVSQGVDRLRITGGEPLVRKGLMSFLSETKELYPDLKIFMTTNGLLINKYLNELVNSQISTINISLDTLDPIKYTSITGSNYLQTVIEGIKSLSQKSNLKIKVNCVLLRGFNDTEIFDFIKFSSEMDVIIRFIEFMPFSGNDWIKNSFISSKEIRNLIESRYTLIKESISHVSQTSRIYTVKENGAKIGFISSVSESFCQWCNRLRITADGNLRTCLHSNQEINLLSLMREGRSDDYIEKAIIKAVYMKSKGHEEFLSLTYKTPDDDREMIRIGG